MLVKTTGIVLNYLKYRETSIICRIFTRELGYRSYIINGVRSAKSKPKMALFQPLTLTDMVVYNKDSQGLNRISEIKCSYPFKQIPFDFQKSGVAMFLAEIIDKCLQDGYENEALFDFLENIIRWLDESNSPLGSFPIKFLLLFSGYLGFAPEDAEEVYEQLFPQINYGDFAKAEKALLNQLLKSDGQYEKVPMKTKRDLLDHLLAFYKLHLDYLTDIKSLAILREIS